MNIDSSLRHLSALKSAFSFAQASEFSWREGADRSYANQVRLVLDSIKDDVPCGTNPAELIPFFLTATWSGRGDAGLLWRAYSQAGYIDPSAPVQMHCKSGPLRACSKDGFVTLLPLEMAIALGHEEGAQALFDSNASPFAVPSRQWKASKKPMDIFGFIKFAARGDRAQQKFKAMAAQALGATPLEMAVFTCDMAKFSALLADGESIARVPSRQWVAGARKPMDTLAFIKFACKDAALRIQFDSLATQALMENLIRRRDAEARLAAPKKKTAKSAGKSPACATAPGAQLEMTFEATAAMEAPLETPTEVEAPPAPPRTLRRRVGI
jgi:hypothetical protein